MMKRIIASLGLALALSAPAHAWWNADWTIRKAVTLDTAAAGVGTDLSSVPVLVRLSTGNFDFLSAKDDGSDIRLVGDDDKTPLHFHVERFDKANELAFVWVQVPKLAANNAKQQIWLYYGNAKAPVVNDSKPTYDATQLLVYHFGEAEGLPKDASPAGLDATAGKVTPVAGGFIAGDVRLAADGGLVAGGAPLQAARELSFSAWVKADKPDGELFSVGGVALSMAGGVLNITANGASAKSSAAMTPAAWHHVALTAGNAYTVYLDGKPVANLAGTFASAASLRIGGGLAGEIDEVQVASAARSADWVLAQYAGQAPEGKLVGIGEDKQADSSESGGTSYFAATMHNVTPDGWVVIGVLMVMFVMAIWVMVAKTMLLARMEKANLSFSEAFSHMSRGLAELDESSHSTQHAGAMDTLVAKMAEFKESSLYRIYHVGVTELKHRFPAVEEGHNFPEISERSMNAVRASLDAQLTREGHKLNRAMVLLTIAISGGPFLGLLGTVVGVMITFAAIAAAGDVNVNAIAPGIAAARVATVAGLAVAIPSLFCYNYLTIKIKQISTDMHVFVDEFVTKMAETYGG